MVATTLKHKTSRVYGYLWDKGRLLPSGDKGHYAALQALLPPGHLRGRILDAGCGAGRDSWEMASCNGAEVWSVDLSWEGVRKTHQRLQSLANTRVLQGDLERLPFQGQSFDFVYSFGVVHHLTDPKRGLQELVRVLKPKGLLTLYVYEDFSTHSRFERAALKTVGVARWITTRLPHRLLYILCQVASPFFFLTFTLLYRLLSRFHFTKRLSDRIPFRHGHSWFGLTADLYDRFAAPIENRYSRETLEAWLAQEQMTDIQIFSHRGWVAFGVKG